MADRFERPDTVTVSVDDLVELIALAQAAEGIACWFNGNVHPTPGWERHAYEAWRIRSESFALEGLDDDDLDRHPIVLETNALSDAIQADTLEKMLADTEERAGLARFFDTEPWTGHVTYPIPFHRLRQEMRARENELRDRQEVTDAC
jgi:hypothetical protein